MSGGFKVDLGALVQAADGINETMSDLRSGKASGNIAGSEADYGDGDLAATVSDFCARWETGVQNLASDASQVASRLYRSAASYAEAEKAVIGQLTGIL
jgi:hypothetical protein